MDKTIVIYDTMGFEPIRYIVVDHDISHLHGKYININASEAESDEMNEILFYPEGHERAWSYKDGIFLDTFPTDLVATGTKVIVMGFPP